jgi:hypothetical protein
VSARVGVLALALASGILGGCAFEVLAEGATVECRIASPLGTTLLEALRGSGRFTVVVAADVEAPIEVAVELALEGVALVEP